MAAVLGYANQIDDGTVSGGSWNASYPLTNIKTPYLFQKARTSNTLATSSVIIIDCATAQTLGVMALISTNLTINATVKVQSSDVSDFASTTYDSGWLTVYDYSDFAVSFTPIAARYWKISISDTGNADGYIEIGRVFLGWQFKPSINIDFGASIGVESDTTSMRALGGPDYFDARPNRRVWRGTWSWLTEPEAYTVMMNILRSQDIDKEVYLMEDDSDTTYQPERWFLARFSTLSSIEWPYLTYHSCGVELVEVI
jgi:hypothetical protein